MKSTTLDTDLDAAPVTGLGGRAWFSESQGRWIMAGSGAGDGDSDSSSYNDSGSDSGSDSDGDSMSSSDPRQMVKASMGGIRFSERLGTWVVRDANSDFGGSDAGSTFSDSSYEGMV